MVSTRKSSVSLRSDKRRSTSGTVSDRAQGAQKAKDALVHSKEFAFGITRRLTLLRELHLADYLTVANGFCGALSILNSAQFLITHERCYMWIALTLPALGFVFDALDGKVARARRTSSSLGQELDSLSDSISFGVAPAMIGFALGLRTAADMAILAFFIVCGVARLARFNSTVDKIPKDKNGQSLYFEGLPIPTSLAIVSLLAYYFNKKQMPLASFHFGTSPYGQVHFLSFLYLIWALAMTSKTMRIPKF